MSKRSGQSSMKRAALPLALLLSFTGCSGEFSKIGGELLGKTGYVSSSQAESVLGAGSKVFEPQKDYTAANEYYLGRAVAANILARYPLDSNTALRKYVTKVGLVVAGNSDLPTTYGGYRFFIVDSQEINALAAPGGFIFVTKGFLKILPDEDALAAVLAHEIGHVVKRHGVEAISSSTRTSSLSALGQVAAEVSLSKVNAPVVNVSALTEQLTAATGEVVEKLVENGYSRSDEYAADEYAVTLLKRSHYNPDSLRVVLNALKTAAESKSGGWMSTHPDPDDRMDEVGTTAGGPPQPSQAVRAGRFRRAVG